MNYKNHKKGVFLTLISISIIMIVVLVAKHNTVKQTEEISPEQFRVVQLNNFLHDLQQNYLEGSLDAASQRAIKSLNFYILKTGSLLDSLNPRFSEVVAFGTIDGTDIDIITNESFMADNSLQDWSSKMEEAVSQSFRSKLNITINNVGIYQSSPWLVTAVANVSINLTDAAANWTIEEMIIATDMDIGLFQDPLFLYKFRGAYNHTVNRSNVQPDKWDTDALNNHIEHGNYVFWGKGKGPSFLMRFTQNALESDTASECCSIESVIDGRKAASAGFGGIKHSIDYSFFRDIDCSDTTLFSIHSIDLGYQPVYFDAENIAKYNIEPTEATNACPEETP